MVRKPLIAATVPAFPSGWRHAESPKEEDERVAAADCPCSSHLFVTGDLLISTMQHSDGEEGRRWGGKELKRR
ncbi:hypothetical protein E2C01_079407 [Portunus trituberculatus]|uniref:Uncharacterized protein n=1 Tax=Portunus trituberculatus TaxID=210409 RepID=A0A5B7ILF8_PORTR|nr:hypothetical protein [Portunus trituberculatus]